MENHLASLLHQSLTNQGANLTALTALGIALAFISADFRSHTSRMLALFLAGSATAIFVNFNFILAPGIEQLSNRQLICAALPSVIAMLAAAEWLLGVRRTIPAGELRTGFGDRLLRAAQLCAVLYLVAAIAMPQWRVDYFLSEDARGAALHHWQSWAFAGPLIVFSLLLLAALLITLRRKPEQAEQRRVLAIVVAIPFLAGALLLPIQWSFYSSLIGQMAVLIGGVQYHVRQGQRAQFMTRFLAPQVAQLVKTKGLTGALKNTSKEIAVVACDLRNFTRYAEQHSPEQVIALLNRYYDSVGLLAERHGATIKDYAGDGILLLVGAPVSHLDNAKRGVTLATDICSEVSAILRKENDELGVGVGVASGPVSVGVVGAQRLEYAAVGNAVNLAARLCDTASDGSVLIDSLTAEQSGNTSLPVEHIQLKGMELPTATRRLIISAAD